MENNDSNIKPQQTGGLKLMTVFIAVLALHVLVIGGFTVYHLMSGGSTDADLLTHKSPKTTDGAIVGETTPPETGVVDKNSTASTAPAETTPAPTPAPTAPVTEQTVVTEQPAPVAPVATTSNTPSGPVIMPPVGSTPAVASPQDPASSTTMEGIPYVVKAHDSFARIARQHGTTVAKLKAANGFTTDKLRIGQKLTIPARTQVASTATTEATGFDPAPSIGTTAKKLTSATAADQAVVVPAASTGHQLYTVAKGDTLTKIARKFKTTPTAIMTANSITDPTKLRIGKKLKIPTQESRSAATGVPAEAKPSPAEAKPATTAQLANYLQ